MFYFDYFLFVANVFCIVFFEGRHDGNRNSIQINTSEDKIQDSENWHTDKFKMWLFVIIAFYTVQRLGDHLFFDILLLIFPAVIFTIVRDVVFDYVNNFYMNIGDLFYIGKTAKTDKLRRKLGKKNILVIRIVLIIIIFALPFIYKLIA